MPELTDGNLLGERRRVQMPSSDAKASKNKAGSVSLVG